jgi:hypothetical protein
MVMTENYSGVDPTATTRAHFPTNRREDRPAHRTGVMNFLLHSLSCTIPAPN